MTTPTRRPTGHGYLTRKQLDQEARTVRTYRIRAWRRMKLIEKPKES